MFIFQRFGEFLPAPLKRATPDLLLRRVSLPSIPPSPQSPLCSPNAPSPPLSLSLPHSFAPPSCTGTDCRRGGGSVRFTAAGGTSHWWKKKKEDLAPLSWKSRDFPPFSFPLFSPLFWIRRNAFVGKGERVNFAQVRCKSLSEREKRVAGALAFAGRVSLFCLLARLL